MMKMAHTSHWLDLLTTVADQGLQKATNPRRDLETSVVEEETLEVEVDEDGVLIAAAEAAMAHRETATLYLPKATNSSTLHNHTNILHSHPHQAGHGETIQVQAYPLFPPVFRYQQCQTLASKCQAGTRCHLKDKAALLLLLHRHRPQAGQDTHKAKAKQQTARS